MKLKLIAIAVVVLMASTAFAQPMPSENYAVFQGMRVHYQNIGVGPEAVVLVHGWSCDQSFWRLQAPELAKQWRIIAVDLPGHGLSDKPKVEYTQDLFARSVAAVMKHAGVEKTVMVGHSMGYGVSRAFCAKYSGKVKGLVVLDGAFNSPPKSDEELEKLKRKADGLMAILNDGDFATAMSGVMAPMHDASTAKEIRSEVATKMLATPPYVARNSMMHCFDPGNWCAVELDVPTLAIYAEKSAGSPGLCPPGVEQQLRKVHPVLEFVMWQDAGHFFMLEKPAELNRAMADFITAVGLVRTTRPRQ